MMERCVETRQELNESGRKRRMFVFVGFSRPYIVRIYLFFKKDLVCTSVMTACLYCSQIQINELAVFKGIRDVVYVVCLQYLSRGNGECP